MTQTAFYTFDKLQALEASHRELLETLGLVLQEELNSLQDADYTDQQICKMPHIIKARAAIDNAKKVQP